MGTYVIKMPDIGEGIAEVELVAWHVAVGDAVGEDQNLADVMTDKAMVEIPSPVVGKVIALGGKPGEVIPVGGELIRLEVEGQGNADDHGMASSGPAAVPDIAPDMAKSDAAVVAEKVVQHAAPAEVAKAPAAPASAPKKAPPAKRPSVARAPGEAPLASPAVRKRAWDLGIELHFVPGSGPGGRVLHEDLDAYQEGAARGHGQAASRYEARHDEEEIQVIGLRRKIAQKMQEAKRRIPHFTYVEEVDVTDLETLRVQLNHTWGQARGKLTLLPFLARAMVVALRDFPQMNARFDDDNDKVTRYGAVHLGIATQSEAGLSVPVLRHAESLDMWATAAEIARLADAVRTGKASRDELSGSSITISSLGPLGGLVSTPVINYPEVAIVGVNRIIERPVFRHGTVVGRKMMNLSSSFDHRVVDGMDAAEFIQAVRRLLETPALLFVE
ncbi:dihydrolipoamide acetyltransferase family protein [Pseudomonas mangiferae]|uniref:Dihydrolipoamide acetyltransferase component of pyruvate dehydrogenase complex n=1 Tax=Pseudomonas mangiferae TaxID=2593654 RepID=A0A553GTF5_9PSED|nr:dihydrolipoamide acetyltransferase family protein [Pseudomonas mangiferae]TRX72777.1 2-oxo acid dehydrogenase subunit E2 [Pseudomonas mangiferae]